MSASIRALLGPRATAGSFVLCLAGLAIAVLALATPGCSGAPTGPEPILSRTPEEAVRAVTRAWSERDTSAYFELLAPGNGQFLSICTVDSALVVTAIHGVLAERYLAARLFRLGTASLPPADRIGISIDGPLESQPARRDPERFRYAVVPMTLGVVTPAGTTFRQGEQFFSLVRGDATIPPGDPTRWYIDGWAEFTLGGVPIAVEAAAERLMSSARGGGATPVVAASACDSALTTTWGSLKEQYLQGYGGGSFDPFRRP
jgi:hypothetical protein